MSISFLVCIEILEWIDRRLSIIMCLHNKIIFLLVVIKLVIIDASHEKVVVDNFGGNCNRGIWID